MFQDEQIRFVVLQMRNRLYDSVNYCAIFGEGIHSVFRGAWVYGGRGRIRDILDEKDDTT